MSRLKVFSVLLMCVISAWCFGNSQDFTMTSQGKLRKYRLHVPLNYSGKKSVALVLMLHGRGGSGPGFENLTGMSQVSEQKGFIVVYPSAIGTPPTWETQWDFSNANTNDVTFLGQLIDRIESKYVIDRKRVYCAGFSAGGFMTHQVGSSLSDRIAAIAVVEGAIGIHKGTATRMISAPSSPVSVLEFHGKKDTTVPYDGGPMRIHPDWIYFPVSRSTSFWAQHDGCSTTPTSTTSNGGNVVRDRYSGGQNGTDVVLYSIANGTHEWPNPATGIDAKNVIWTFFANHPKP